MASVTTGYIGEVQIDSGNVQNIGSTAYGECSTAAKTAAKTVEMTGFTLIKGATIHVKFTEANGVSKPTLNVNSTGAKSIMRYGTTAPSTSSASSWAAGAVVSFTYDGTYWVMNDWVNSTYSALVNGYCTTAAGTAEKAVTCSNCGNLVEGSIIIVRFTITNTAASALTINVNSLGAKTLYINGTVSSSSNYSLPAGIRTLRYDGTYWHVRNDGYDPIIPYNSYSATQDASGNVITDTYQLKTTAVTHTASTAVGSATQPTYVDSDGVSTACTYELNKTVPSDAVFTDTDTKVKSNLSTSNVDNLILLNNGSSETTDEAYMKSGVSVNPSTGNMKVYAINSNSFTNNDASSSLILSSTSSAIGSSTTYSIIGSSTSSNIYGSYDTILSSAGVTIGSSSASVNYNTFVGAGGRSFTSYGNYNTMLGSYYGQTTSMYGTYNLLAAVDCTGGFTLGTSNYSIDSSGILCSTSSNISLYSTSSSIILGESGSTTINSSSTTTANKTYSAISLGNSTKYTSSMNYIYGSKSSMILGSGGGCTNYGSCSSIISSASATIGASLSDSSYSSIIAVNSGGTAIYGNGCVIIGSNSSNYVGSSSKAANNSSLISCSSGNSNYGNYSSILASSSGGNTLYGEGCLIAANYGGCTIGSSSSNATYSAIIGTTSGNQIYGGAAAGVIIGTSSGGNYIQSTASGAVIMSANSGGNNNYGSGSTMISANGGNTIASGSSNATIIGCPSSTINGGFFNTIIGGTGGTSISSTCTNTIVIGCSSLSATESNTVYLPNVIVTGALGKPFSTTTCSPSYYFSPGEIEDTFGISMPSASYSYEVEGYFTASAAFDMTTEVAIGSSTVPITWQGDSVVGGYSYEFSVKLVSASKAVGYLNMLVE